MNINFLAAAAAPSGGLLGGSGMWIYIIVLFAIMYFLMIRPQKKRQKEEQAMRDNVQVGDEITTIGGIMGTVVTIKEDSLIIETSANRNKLKITKSAVGINNTANEKIAAEREAAKAAQEKEKQAKLEAKGKTKSRKKKDLEDKY